MAIVRRASALKFLSLAGLSASICLSFQARADINTLVTDYVHSSSVLVQQLEILKKDAGSCGMIGGQIADRMESSIKGQRQQTVIVLDAVKKGHSGQAVIKKEIGEVEKSNAELKSNLSMARYGLSTDSPSCKRASAAFDLMTSESLAMPKKLKSIFVALKVI